MRKRDQAGKVYKAEALAMSVYAGGNRKEEMTLQEAQKFVDAVMKRSYVRKNYFFKYPIKVLDGRGRRSACATFRDGEFAICLPKQMRNKYVILHEIAHHINRGHGHHAWFTSCLLDLVRNVLGKEQADALQGAFHFTGVKVRGKNGDVKARLPKSRVQWLQETKERFKKIETGEVKVYKGFDELVERSA
jgi:putative metallohydrolase (TIGR04338 family)